jgi:hypothetical protein
MGYRHKRGTTSQIVAAAAANELLQGEVYLDIDENRLVAASAANAYINIAKMSDIYSAARDKSVSAILPGNAAVVSYIGTSYFSAGTISHPTTTNSTIKTKTRRWVNTSTAVAGNVCFHRAPVNEFSRDTGFSVLNAGGITTLVSGNRWFMGITTVGGNPTNVDPLASTTGSKIGLAVNASTGNVFLVHNLAGSAPTTIDLGANFPVTAAHIYMLDLVCVPGSSSVRYIVTNTSNNAVMTGLISTNLPTLSEMMAKVVWGTNNATASAFAMDIARLYSEV